VRFLQILSMIFIILLCIIAVDIKLYPYSEKKKNIEDVAEKMEYIRPSFSFTSKEYKRFVYEQ